MKNVIFIILLIAALIGGVLLARLLPADITVSQQTVAILNKWSPDSPVMSADQITRKDATKPKNIILLIGDGMGLTQVSAGMAANGNSLQLERCTHTGLIKTSAADKYITDSAASGTAMSSGIKTNNRMIAMTPDGTPTETILEIAEKRGMATGLIATSIITHATPASFIAHQKSRHDYEAIAADFLNTEVEVVIGGGMENFTQREDNMNLVEQLKDQGYQVFDNLGAAIESDATKFYALCAEEDMPTMTEGRGSFLREAIKKAISVLDKQDAGFFMMAESSQIDWGGHANDAEYVVSEMLDFDEAIGDALDFAVADSETLVIITADHETGGMSLTGYDSSSSELTFAFGTGGHTPVMVPVFAFGPGAENFGGIYENTEIFHKMLSLLTKKVSEDL